MLFEFFVGGDVCEKDKLHVFNVMQLEQSSSSKLKQTNEPSFPIPWCARWNILVEDIFWRCVKLVDLFAVCAEPLNVMWTLQNERYNITLQ